MASKLRERTDKPHIYFQRYASVGLVARVTLTPKPYTPEILKKWQTTHEVIAHLKKGDNMPTQDQKEAFDLLVKLSFSLDQHEAFAESCREYSFDSPLPASYIHQLEAAKAYVNLVREEVNRYIRRRGTENGGKK